MESFVALEYGSIPMANPLTRLSRNEQLVNKNKTPSAVLADGVLLQDFLGNSKNI
jgi:hypothetical protein